MTAIEHGVRLSRTSPAFLHANSTSHTWIFSALAEIIDNAYDPDVGASVLRIDTREISERTSLVFSDNGLGMDANKLHNMLSFGYCEKADLKASYKPVGQYGNGFKSGSMRLGKDAIVFTRGRKTCSVGFLSQTFLERIGADTVLTPIVSFHKATMQLVVSEDTTGSLACITEHSIFKTLEAICQELTDMSAGDNNTTGTRIFVYNLQTCGDGMYELDFKSDPQDIINSEHHAFDQATGSLRPMSDYEPAYRRSLREYCSILFLKPRMKIFLRGEKVKTKLISTSLQRTEIDFYRPKFLRQKQVKIIFGFGPVEEDCGLMMYHRNRLIKAYEKVGCQKLQGGQGKGVVGVVEVDFLEPVHNKQEFNKTDKYNAAMAQFAQKLNDYYHVKTNTVDPVGESLLSNWTWAQCDNPQCLKWRRLPNLVSGESLPDKWFCPLNRDPTHNRCDIPEEPEDEDALLLQRESYAKSVKQRRSTSGQQPTMQQREKYVTEKERELMKVKEEIEKRLASPTDSDQSRSLARELDAARQRELGHMRYIEQLEAQHSVWAQAQHRLTQQLHAAENGAVLTAINDIARNGPAQLRSAQGGSGPPAMGQSGGPAIGHSGGSAMRQIGPTMGQSGGPAMGHSGGPTMRQIGPMIRQSGGLSMGHSGVPMMGQIGPTMGQSGGPAMGKTGSAMGQSGGSGMGQTGSAMGQSGPRMRQSGPGMEQNGGPMMGQSDTGLRQNGAPGLRQNGPWMGPNGPWIGSNGLRMRLNDPGMGQNRPGMRPNDPWMGQNGPRMGQNGLGMRPNVPEMGQNRPEMRPNGPEMGQNGLELRQMGSGMLQNGPRMEQIGPVLGQSGPMMGHNVLGMEHIGPGIVHNGFGMEQNIVSGMGSSGILGITPNGPILAPNGPGMNQNGPEMEQNGSEMGQNGPERKKRGPRKRPEGPVVQPNELTGVQTVPAGQGNEPGAQRQNTPAMHRSRSAKGSEAQQNGPVSQQNAPEIQHNESLTQHNGPVTLRNLLTSETSSDWSGQTMAQSGQVADQSGATRVDQVLAEMNALAVKQSGTALGEKEPATEQMVMVRCSPSDIIDSGAIVVVEPTTTVNDDDLIIQQNLDSDSENEQKPKHLVVSFAKKNRKKTPDTCIVICDSDVESDTESPQPSGKARSDDFIPLEGGVAKKADANQADTKKADSNGKTVRKRKMVADVGTPKAVKSNDASRSPNAAKSKASPVKGKRPTAHPGRVITEFFTGDKNDSDDTNPTKSTDLINSANPIKNVDPAQNIDPASSTNPTINTDSVASASSGSSATPNVKKKPSCVSKTTEPILIVLDEDDLTENNDLEGNRSSSNGDSVGSKAGQESRSAISASTNFISTDSSSTEELKTQLRNLRLNVAKLLKTILPDLVIDQNRLEYIDDVVIEMVRVNVA